MTLLDDDQVSSTKETTALITGAGLKEGVLQIVGTAGKDRVEVEAEGRCDQRIEVEANFLPGRGHERSFRLDEVSRIVILLGPGNDEATIEERVRTPVLMEGGSGDDYLKAGGGPAVILGGRGDDWLVGGKGRNVLIGGFGADRLVGGCDDDILIGGTTAYDADPEALRAILAEWSRTDLGYSQRVSDLMNGGGLNGTFKLNEETVFGDLAKDILTGGSGKDWFFADGCGWGADRVTDRQKSEVVTQPAVQLAEEKPDHFGHHGDRPWIDWSDHDCYHYGHAHSTFHSCPSWVGDFVSDLARSHDRDPNSCIQVVLAHADDYKPKSTFGVSRR